MKYDEAMASEDRHEWKKAVDEEHQRMVERGVFEPVQKTKIPENAKVVTSTWAMKKKSNGVHRARINARGFEQVDGMHYDQSSIAAPVANKATIRIFMILMIMAGWYAEILDVKGAFLHGEFEDGEEIYMEVPQGFEEYYPDNVLLKLLRTLYGLKQAAMAFWRQLLKAFRNMNYERSKADPCLYFAWTVYGLILWLSWIDDCVCAGKTEGVLMAKKQMMDRFDCDEVGEMKEYVGCKIDHNFDERWIKITQPVLLQSFQDEFDLPDTKPPKTPAEPGTVLVNGKSEESLATEKQSKYRSGVGKLLHLMRWSRPETLNSVRECSRFMSKAVQAHLKALYRIMHYCVGTPERGLLLKPNAKWDGSPDFKFEVNGRSDSTYASDPDTRRSVSGYHTMLNGAPVTMKSGMQKIVALSVTEAELIAAVLCAQDMLFVYKVITLLRLKVELAMILEVDNKGAFDLINNWTIGRRTRHVEVRQYFLRELKEEGIIKTVWLSGDKNSTDLFTKNLGGPAFEKHAGVYVNDV